MGAAAVAERHDAAVGAELVGAHAERLPEEAADRQQEAAAAALAGGGLRHRRVGPEVAVVPPVRGQAATVRRQHGLATEPELPLLGAQRREGARGLVVGLERVGAAVAGLEPGVVGRRGVQVAGVEVAGAHALGPRHPRGGQDRVVAGEQHDLGDGRCLAVRHDGDGHGPGPAAVAAGQAGEGVGGEAVGGGGDADVVTDVVRGRDLEHRGAGEVDGRRQDGVRRGRGHGAILAHGAVRGTAAPDASSPDCPGPSPQEPPTPPSRRAPMQSAESGTKCRRRESRTTPAGGVRDSHGGGGPPTRPRGARTLEGDKIKHPGRLRPSSASWRSGGRACRRGSGRGAASWTCRRAA